MIADAPRILVVDDEEDICHNLLDILNDLGCHVEIATDGLSALELARRNEFRYRACWTYECRAWTA